MAYKLKITNEAQDDFRGMFNYYLEETQDITHTEKIIKNIRNKIENQQFLDVNFLLICQ